MLYPDDRLIMVKAYKDPVDFLWPMRDEYEAAIGQLRAECDALAAKLEAANAIIARIDKVAPRADSGCVKSGMKLSTAVRHQLRDEGHPLFKSGQPAPSGSVDIKTE